MLAAIACTGGSGGSTGSSGSTSSGSPTSGGSQSHASGQVGGYSLDVQDVIAVSNAASPDDTLILGLSSVTGHCAAAQGNGFTWFAGETEVTITVSGHGSPLVTGTAYQVTDTGCESGACASAQFNATGEAGCSGGFSEDAYDGSVTLQTLTDGTVSGSFSLKFKSGTLDGTFDQSLCTNVPDKNAPCK